MHDLREDRAHERNDVRLKKRALERGEIRIDRPIHWWKMT